MKNMQKKREAAPQFEINWRTIKDWKVDSRYERRSEKQAWAIYTASTEAANGIMPWIEEHW